MKVNYKIKFKIINSLIILLLFICTPIFLYASIEIEGSLKHIYKGNKGEVYKGTIKIHNSDKTNQEVKIYQTELLYNYNDFTFYDDPGTNLRSNANWVKYSPKTVIVKGEESIYIQYEVCIPKDDTIKGTYWSVLMIEGVNSIDTNQAGQMNINTITRYAVQLITEINGNSIGKLEFLSPTLINDNGKLFLAVDITNTGEHYILPEVSIEFFDETGRSIKKVIAAKKGLFPTTSNRYRFSLEGLVSGKTYAATIVAAGSDEDVFGLDYTLYF
jgi:hypothetical protein